MTARAQLRADRKRQIACALHPSGWPVRGHAMRRALQIERAIRNRRERVYARVIEPLMGGCEPWSFT